MHADLEQATKLARNMVTKYGMSEKVGNISIDYEDDGRSLSSETRSAVEEEVCVDHSMLASVCNHDLPQCSACYFPLLITHLMSPSVRSVGCFLQNC